MVASAPRKKKHRLAAIEFAAEYDDDIPDGAALEATGHTVLVGQRDEEKGGAWVEKTAEFGSPSGSTSGTQVRFTLAAAGAGEQAEGTYFVVVLAAVDNGEVLPAVMELEVTAEADASAPAV